MCGFMGLFFYISMALHLQPSLMQSESLYFFVGSLDNKHGSWCHHWEHTCGGASGASFQQPGHLSLFLNCRHCYLLVHVPQEAGACSWIQEDRNTVSIYCVHENTLSFKPNLFHAPQGFVELYISLYSFMYLNEISVKSFVFFSKDPNVLDVFCSWNKCNTNIFLRNLIIYLLWYPELITTSQ